MAEPSGSLQRPLLKGEREEPAVSQAHLHHPKWVGGGGDGEDDNDSYNDNNSHSMGPSQLQMSVSLISQQSYEIGQFIIVPI